MAENVRLVIWDLDQTFWAGTLAEGGITAYIESHHDVVIALARRGIISSICSKNDYATVKSVMQERGIWEYFVFPSINWLPKADRIAAIIEATHLRPANALFIDDSPANLAEAKARLPELQVGDSSCIPTLLDSPLLNGKSDETLSRLAQYKLLEQRQAHLADTHSDNTEFLRRSNITVSIDTNIERNIDRAIELINRTNQLNFTKQRLPNDPNAAREQLRKDISPFYMQAGLLRVTDRYGDYGYCGFYCLSPDWVQYFCFSCRILGMGIEQWLYQRLGRPSLQVVGEVATDVTVAREIDWIGFCAFGPNAPRERTKLLRFGEVRLRGGCEIDAVAHYFRLQSHNVVPETNRRRGPFFIRYDCTQMLMHAITASPLAELHELRSLGFAEEDLTTRFFAPAEQGTILVYSGWGDLYQQRYRHRHSGVCLPVDIVGVPGDLRQSTPEMLAEAARAEHYTVADVAAVNAALTTLRTSFDYLGVAPDFEITQLMETVFDSIPHGASLFVVLPFTQWRNQGKLEVREEVIVYKASLVRLAAQRSNVHLVDVDDAVQSAGELLDEFAHFNRLVYFRIFEAILAAATTARWT